MKAIGYARVSTPKQSPDLQIRAIQTYAEQNGYEVEIFSETASGKGLLHKYLPHIFDSVRPALWNAVNKAKQEQLPIIVLNLDRISRAVKDGMWVYFEAPKIISINEGNITTEKAHLLFSAAESERQKCSERTKSALVEAQKRLIEKRQKRYKNTFHNEGAPEYVVDYVAGEIYSDCRTKRAHWQDGDFLSCIDTAWGDLEVVDYLNPTLEESTLVAECALSYISTRKSRKDCSVECPTEGWIFNDELGYQVEINSKYK